MELQIPHRVRTEVQKAGGLRPAAHGDREDTEGAVQEEGDRDPGGRSMPRSYTHAAVDTAEVQRVERDGVSEGEEQPDDLRQVREPEVQVREQGILVPRVLC